MQVYVVKPGGQVAVETIFMFSHQAATAYNQFVSITTSTNDTISATAGHYLPVSKTSFSTFSDAKPVRAADVGIGDTLWRLTGTIMQPVRVKSVTHLGMTGLYNPHTPSGTIVVDNLAAFTFTDSILPSLTAHRLATFVPYAMYIVSEALGLQAFTSPFNSLLLHLYHDNALSALSGFCSGVPFVAALSAA